ncbi:hypothetical protein GCM10011289_19640 [Paludibacterium paludis]|uniref:Uncharacterized protein n=1 Tax=Paludibacterium paludis TaxID=1225769 RepID=A0A918P463_9NEIS|nr:hypothetical protein GCM10011289_19640 [Paludibacterium paludis]
MVQTEPPVQRQPAGPGSQGIAKIERPDIQGGGQRRGRAGLTDHPALQQHAHREGGGAPKRDQRQGGRQVMALYMKAQQAEGRRAETAQKAGGEPPVAQAAADPAARGDAEAAQQQRRAARADW